MPLCMLLQTCPLVEIESNMGAVKAHSWMNLQDQAKS